MWAARRSNGRSRYCGVVYGASHPAISTMININVRSLNVRQRGRGLVNAFFFLEEMEGW